MSGGKDALDRADDRQDDLDDRERTLLSKARRFKSNDGVIDDAKRNELVDLALTLGLDSVQRESLIERAEREYESESERLRTGDSSDGRDRKLAFLDWRRWRMGPLRYVRMAIGSTRNRLLSRGIVRPTGNRAFGGICSGVSLRFGISPMLLRAMALFAVMWYPYLLIVYVIVWILMPNESERFVP